MVDGEAMVEVPSQVKIQLKLIDLLLMLLVGLQNHLFQITLPEDVWYKLLMVSVSQNQSQFLFIPTEQLQKDIKIEI